MLDRNRWYTSAYVQSGTEGTSPNWRWVDGSSFGSTVFWVNEFEPEQGTGNHVVYKYYDEAEHQAQPGYFWFRDAGTIPYHYICEIGKTDSSKIISKERDFGKSRLRQTLV